MCYLHLLYSILFYNLQHILRSNSIIKKGQKGKINIQCTSLYKNENFHNLGIRKMMDIDSSEMFDSQSVFISIFVELTIFRIIYQSNQDDKFTILHKNLLHLQRCVFGDLNNSKFLFTFYCDFSGM